MHSVIVCAVLAIAGNAGSFVLDRTNADLEQSILDFYSPMGSKMHQSSNINTDTEESDLEETEEEYSPESDIKITPNDYFDPPLLSKSNQHASLAMGDGTRKRGRVGENVHEDIPREDLDANVLKAIWAESSASSKKLNDEKANNTFGLIFKDKHRYLSEFVPKKSWEKNAGNEQKSIKNDMKSLHSLEPEQNSTPSRVQSNPLPDQRSSSHREHNIFITLENILDVQNIFGSPESPPESMTLSTESYSATNETGSTFKEEDRFLSESLLRTNWQNNIKEDGMSAITTNPLTDKRSVSRRDGILIPSENNASSKHISTFLALTIACFFCISYS